MNRILLPIICAAITACVLRPSYASEMPVVPQNNQNTLQKVYSVVAITTPSLGRCTLY